MLNVLLHPVERVQVPAHLLVGNRHRGDRQVGLHSAEVLVVVGVARAAGQR